jgi:hypothetical protein
MANNESVLKKHFDCNKVPEALLTLIMQGLYIEMLSLRSVE